MKPKERVYPNIASPKPRRRWRWGFWRRPEPTLYQKCLAVHVIGAAPRSALR